MRPGQEGFGIGVLLPISRKGMPDSVRPPADLFDESPLYQPVTEVRHVGAVAAMTPTRPADALDGYIALRWRAAGTSLALAAAVAVVFRFPIWAVGGLALFVGMVNLWPLPPLAKRGWLISAASFFFAQATSIFVTPFTWPMRFGFCAALLIGLALAPPNRDE